MTSVMKSPNMMSTTGRIPVIAAPSARPAIPASEIGESMIRCGPNSSSSPDSTLNGVPASATSSPITKTLGSRRSSSASASLTACDSVSSRVSCGAATAALGEDMLIDLRFVRILRREGELDARVDLPLHVVRDALELRGVHALLSQPRAEQRDRVSLRLPPLLLLLRAVVGAINVADVMAVIAVGLQDEERRPVATPGPLDRAACRSVDRAHVLSVDLRRRDSERLGPRRNVARSRLRVQRVFAVQIVLARVDDRQLPERRHVHHLVEEPLAERALAEEADGDLVGASQLRALRRAGRDPRGAAHDRVRTEVAVLVVGDVHRAALAAAVARLLA